MKRGFTLIELLVVIAVIGVLAAGVIMLLNPVAQFQKAQDAKRKADLSQIQKALEAYYGDNGRYPTAENYKIVGIKRDGSIGPLDWGISTGWSYMDVLPKDPSSSKKYSYVSTGQAYYLYASLDRGATGVSNPPSEGSCGSVSCNYGVSSLNVSP